MSKSSTWHTDHKRKSKGKPKPIINLILSVNELNNIIKREKSEDSTE